MYNAKNSLVYEKAVDFKGKFVLDYNAVINKTKMEADVGRCSPPSIKPNTVIGTCDESLRRNQKQLLLLYHSSKCMDLTGTCPLAQRCVAMKVVWKHLAKCSDNNCQMRHCFLSRKLLDHTVECKDRECSLCIAVRKARSRRKKTM